MTRRSSSIPRTDATASIDRMVVDECRKVSLAHGEFSQAHRKLDVESGSYTAYAR
jgi:hypothetical protein